MHIIGIPMHIIGIIPNIHVPRTPIIVMHVLTQLVTVMQASRVAGSIILTY